MEGQLVKIKCRRCGYETDDITFKCKKCGKERFKDYKMETVPNEDADFNTHYQTRYNCMKCDADGIVWVQKGKKLRMCPKCSEPVRTNNVGAKGRVSSVWDASPLPWLDGGWEKAMIAPHNGGGYIKIKIDPPVEPEKKPLRHCVECPECGWLTTYIFHYPDRCNHCGKVLPPEENSIITVMVGIHS